MFWKPNINQGPIVEGTLKTQIKICPYISPGINSHSQIAPVKLKAKKTHPSRPGHMRNAFLSAMPGRPPLCTPKTSARPPPTCPASSRQWPSCSPRWACGGVGLPIGTRSLPRLGGAALQPRGSRWSAEVSKHEKSPSSGPMCHGKGRKANKGHNFWTIVRTYYSKRSSSTLWIHGMPRSIKLLNLLTVFARIAGPLSQNNPGAPTEVATARMTGHHLKHCQTPSKIINGLNLLRASKSPAEHVGRLDMARWHITRKSPTRLSRGVGCPHFIVLKRGHPSPPRSGTSIKWKHPGSQNRCTSIK